MDVGNLGSPGKRARPKDSNSSQDHRPEGWVGREAWGWVSGTHEAGLGHPQNWAGA